MGTLPRKAVMYRALKAAQEAGHPIVFDRNFVQYTEFDFEEMFKQFNIPDPTRPQEVEEAPVAPDFDWGQAAGTAPKAREVAASAPPAAQVSPGAPAGRRPVTGPRATPLARVTPQEQAAHLQVPLTDQREERAGLHFNDEFPDAAIRVDSAGRVWYQDEVQKPAIPKARMVRTTNYIDPGFQESSTQRADGGLDETFEIAGQQSRVMQIKTTVPSWQVGIYKDPRMPFKIHTYGDINGFDFNEIVTFWGGIDLLPTSIKRKYVGNDLCFDIKSVRDTMEQEHEAMVLRERNNR